MEGSQGSFLGRALHSLDVLYNTADVYVFTRELGVISEFELWSAVSA